MSSLVLLCPVLSPHVLSCPLVSSHICCVAASPLVVAVEGRLSILLLPAAPEGPGDVPAGAELAEEHLVQAGALVVLGAVFRLLRHFLKPQQY